MDADPDGVGGLAVCRGDDVQRAGRPGSRLGQWHGTNDLCFNLVAGVSR
jgi:hypothetical protein